MTVQQAAIFGYTASFLAPSGGAASGESAGLRRGTGDESRTVWVHPELLTDDEAVQLEREIAAGEIRRIRFTAEIFGDVPNHNRIRSEPGRLPEMARAFAGKNLVTNHGRYLRAIVGTVTEARTVFRDGAPRLVADHDLVDRDEMVDFVQGRRRFFSISFGAEEWVCSSCETPARIWFFGPELACRCDPREVEIFGRGEISVSHNSFVAEPAYEEAGLLSAYSRANRSGAVLFGAAPINPDARPDQQARHGEEHSSMPGKDTAAKLAALEAQLAAEKTAREQAELAARTARDEATSAQEAAKLAAEKQAEAAAEAAKAQAAELAAQKARLGAAFDSACKERRVSPAEKEAFEVLFEAKGIDYALSQLASRKPNPAFAGEPVGHDPAAFNGSPEDTSKRTEWMLAEEMARIGVVSPASVEHRKKGGTVILHPDLNRAA